MILPVFLGCLLLTPAIATANHCPDDWEATLISVEGSVQIRSGRTAGWADAYLGQPICRGQVIRVREHSRAGIRLPDDSMMRLDQMSTLALPDPPNGQGTLLHLLRGVLHLFSRNPRELRIDTPYANAGLEGTEFVLSARDGRSDVTVIEGEVILSNDTGSISVRDGQRGTASAQNLNLEVSDVSDPLEAVSWALFYVPVLVGDAGFDSVETGSTAVSPAMLVSRAAHAISVGRSTEAQADLAQLLSTVPAADQTEVARAHALLAVIALTQGDRPTARIQANLAVSTAPDAAAGWLALSHVEQAEFNLSAALHSAQRAAALAPIDAIAWARVGELQLANGDVSNGIRTAQRAATLDPQLGHAHTVLGFGELMRMRQRQSATAFREAIAQDPSAPLPRLGLGLALLRQRQVSDARAQIELAVLLDPRNALLRSYVARAYHDEDRGIFSDAQIDLAKQLDPFDPTPWLYDALRKQSANQPVEALLDLERAFELNDNRPVLRSRLLLDEDLGTRSGAFGRIHRELGFEQLALLKGWESVNRDPIEYSGHRLLADVYSALPLHQIARMDELYQSQLLQPANVTPIPPLLAEANLFILDSAGPAELAFAGLTPLASAGGFSAQGSVVTAGHGTRGTTAMLAGHFDQLSFSAGYSDFVTEGFRPNNDLDQQVANVFLQTRPGTRTSVMTELRTSRIEKGDIRLLHDFDAFDAHLRQYDREDSVRAGVRYALSSSSDLIGSFIYQSADGYLNLPAVNIIHQRTSSSADIQYVLRHPHWSLLGGIRYQTRNGARTLSFPTQPALPPLVTPLTTPEGNAYGYLHLHPSDRWQATFGISADQARTAEATRRTVNPKLGITWQLNSRTTVRAAVFRNLQGLVPSKQHITPKLEPTQVAGFSQRYFAVSGEQNSRYAAAIDFRGSEFWYAGAELSQRKLSYVTSRPSSGGQTITAVHNRQEDIARAYVYWAPTHSLALNAYYQHERLDGRGTTTVDGYGRISTHRLPASIQWFHRSGLRLGFQAARVHQHGLFATRAAAPSAPLTDGSDRFWVFDASAGYRLPNRRGLLTLHAHNLLDTRFRFQDLDPDNPQIIPMRMVALRFTVAH